MGVIDLNVKLLDQLPIDGLNDLPDGVEGLTNRDWGLIGLVARRQSHEFKPLVLEQLLRQVRTDIALVAKDRQIGVFRQEVSPHSQVRGTGRGQFNRPPKLTNRWSLKPKMVMFLLAHLP